MSSMRTRVAHRIVLKEIVPGFAGRTRVGSLDDGACGVEAGGGNAGTWPEDATLEVGETRRDQRERPSTWRS